MRRVGLFLFCLLVVVSGTVWAGSYTLIDGTRIEGDPISETDNGVVFHTADGTDLERIPFDKLTQDSIRELLAKATTAREKGLLEPLLDELPQEKPQPKEIVVKPVQTPDRPKAHLGIMAVFASPVGLMILLILYGANLFAAYEVAVYRNQPLSTVCGLAAVPFFGVLSPIIFLAMPNRLDEGVVDEEPQTRFRATPPPTAVSANLPEEMPEAGSAEHPAAPAQASGAARHPAVPLLQEMTPVLPEPIIFQRGNFSFNRRFFETKLAGFFRLVPSEADKDMVIHIKSGRGDFTGRRITRITPTELYLQVFHGNATADEMIPFVEVLEVQVRHKDTV
jgi:hypothetical protein